MQNSFNLQQARIGTDLTAEGNPQLKRGTVLLDPETGYTYVAREAYDSMFTEDGVFSQAFSEMVPTGSHGMLTAKLPETAQVIWVPNYDVAGF